ncbi:ATP-binding cassette domain-containing protein [Paenibacillus sp. N10]|uniref:ATP-binding cassette domain-containing protein n=2 Tax=Paenibacillus lutrae TaxID=2078573 RepID=A0A7X3FKY0_9BACL|nr:ABC transporter ATP-binding protein [Paenibacillus lutrae]MVP01651.1 ATP-binding cassette domain-containing protein [Paenibacillus lutrae]
MGGGPGRGAAHGGSRVLPKVRPKNTGATLSRLSRYLGRQRKGLITVIILTVLSAGAGLIAPYLLGRAIDAYIIPRDYSGLLQLCFLLLGLYVFSSAMLWFQAYVMAGVTQRTVGSLRQDLFTHLQKLPLKFFDSRTHGELMSRTTNDIENVSNTLNQSLIQLMTSVVTIIGSLAFMLAMNVWLTLVSLASIPLIIFLTGQISRRTRNHFKSQQKNLGELNGFIEETISGQKVIKVLRREEQAAAQFNTINAALRKAGTQAQIYSGMVGPFNNVVNNFSFALIAAIGGWMVINGWTTLGIIVSFLNYSRQFTRPINELANQYNLIQSGIAGAERVFEVLDEGTEYTSGESGAGTDTEAASNELTGGGSKQISEPAAGRTAVQSVWAADGQNRKASNGPAPLQPLAGKVEFKDVSFSYHKESPILSDVTFAANPGDTVALVGPTGAGKTTIVNLLTRFYDIDQGSISIDDEDIRHLDKSFLRSQLGIVLQDAYLFSDTLRENIRYGRLDATDEEVEAAARLANADGFIRKLPQGYDSVLSAEGSNLSHGQRQLITIARAILADPAILILDEATSSVDTRTEMHIQEAMGVLMRGRTSFVIAHRLSTIRDADLILVLSSGRIIERGTHEELLNARGFYYDLYSSQFREIV